MVGKYEIEKIEEITERGKQFIQEIIVIDFEKAA